MKKQVKKLVLAKETLRELGAFTLGKVAGGSALPQFHCGPDTYDNSCHICLPEPISYDTNC